MSALTVARGLSTHSTPDSQWEQQLTSIAQRVKEQDHQIEESRSLSTQQQNQIDALNTKVSGQESRIIELKNERAILDRKITHVQTDFRAQGAELKEARSGLNDAQETNSYLKIAVTVLSVAVLILFIVILI